MEFFHQQPVYFFKCKNPGSLQQDRFVVEIRLSEICHKLSSGIIEIHAWNVTEFFLVRSNSLANPYYTIKPVLFQCCSNLGIQFLFLHSALQKIRDDGSVFGMLSLLRKKIQRNLK